MRRGVSLRLVILIDSNVVRCAASKGGSSSKALSPALFRLAAFCIIGGRYLVFRFCPSWLYPSGDPTRDVVLRDPTPSLDLAAWGRRDLYRLAASLSLRCWASYWILIFPLMLGPFALHLTGLSTWPLSCLLSLCFAFCLDFVATLGFPGEGPLCLVSRVSYLGGFL